jgi:hypothetical protein
MQSWLISVNDSNYLAISVKFTWLSRQNGLAAGITKSLESHNPLRHNQWLPIEVYGEVPEPKFEHEHSDG